MPPGGEWLDLLQSSSQHVPELSTLVAICMKQVCLGFMRKHPLNTTALSQYIFNTVQINYFIYEIKAISRRTIFVWRKSAPRTMTVPRAHRTYFMETPKMYG